MRYGKVDGVKMLKIRDGVDLKELEKFGFRKSGGIYQIDLEIDWTINPPFGWIISCIYIQKDNRIIRISTHEKHEVEITEISVLYDLIKADLVEKV